MNILVPVRVPQVATRILIHPQWSCARRQRKLISKAHEGPLDCRSKVKYHLCSECSALKLSCLCLTWKISSHLTHGMCGELFLKANFSYPEKTGGRSYRQRMVGKSKTGDAVKSQILPGDTEDWLETKNSRRQVINWCWRTKETTSLNSVHNQRERHLECLEPQEVSDMHSIESRRPILCRESLDQIAREPPDVLIRTPGAKLSSDKVLYWWQEGYTPEEPWGMSPRKGKGMI